MGTTLPCIDTPHMLLPIDNIFYHLGKLVPQRLNVNFCSHVLHFAVNVILSFLLRLSAGNAT